MDMMRLLARAAVAAALVLVLMVGLLLIGGLISERTSFRDQAVARVAASRAGEQVLSGPLRILPWSELQAVAVDQQAEPGQTERYRKVSGFDVQMPASLQIDGQLHPEQRRVGLFQVPVYSWKGKISARFAPLRQVAAPGRTYGEPYLAIGLSDVRGMVGTPQLQLDGRSVGLQSGTRELRGMAAGVHAPLAWQADGRLHGEQLAMELVLDGTRSLSLLPVGDDNRFALRSRWPHPAFGGDFPPISPEVGEGGFSAQWAVSALASQAQTQLRKTLAGEHGSAPERVEVSLIDPVDVYTMAARATKYGVLFIVLTFVGFGLMDVVRRLNIHPVQYLLVGMALTVFFLLLLSLSEHLPFALAYLLASAACIGIQSYYLSGVLRSWPRALGFAAMLSVLYGALYGLLVSEQTALLMGSLLLFAVLSAVMGITRKLDWRALGKGNG